MKKGQSLELKLARKVFKGSIGKLIPEEEAAQGKKAARSLHSLTYNSVLSTVLALPVSQPVALRPKLKALAMAPGISRF